MRRMTGCSASFTAGRRLNASSVARCSLDSQVSTPSHCLPLATSAASLSTAMLSMTQPMQCASTSTRRPVRLRTCRSAAGMSISAGPSIAQGRWALSRAELVRKSSTHTSRRATRWNQAAADVAPSDGCVKVLPLTL